MARPPGSAARTRKTHLHRPSGSRQAPGDFQGQDTNPFLPQRQKILQGETRIKPDISYRNYAMRLPGSIPRSEEHTSELQSLMRISYAVFCLKKKKKKTNRKISHTKQQ